jgi:hypothetical protein
MITVFVFTNRTRTSTKAKLAQAKAKVKAAKVAGNPLVSFSYPLSKEPWNSKQRYVRLISANQKYLLGLEVTALPSGEQKYAFKKFLAPKVRNMAMVEFAPASMS